jgi:hypothetical protein
VAKDKESSGVTNYCGYNEFAGCAKYE